MDRLNQISIFPIIDADAKSPAVWESNILLIKMSSAYTNRPDGDT